MNQLRYGNPDMTSPLPCSASMKDVQNQRDDRNIPIDKVGIKNIRYPITVLDRRNSRQHTVATINMYVDLPHKYKGTHMSRFVELLHLFRPEISLKRISEVLDRMKKHLNAASAHIEVSFPYFIEKKAPVSGAPGLMDYTCRILGSSDPSRRNRPGFRGDRSDFIGLPLFQGNQRCGRPQSAGRGAAEHPVQEIHLDGGHDRAG